MDSKAFKLAGTALNSAHLNLFSFPACVALHNLLAQASSCAYGLRF